MSEFLERLKREQGDKFFNLMEQNPRRIYLEISPESLPELVQYFIHQLNLRFITATAMEMEREFEVLYHFAEDREGKIISVRMRLSPANPVAPSLSSLTKAMDFIEREVYEMLGINFLGHPELKPLLLSEEQAQNFHPLRRKK